MCQIAICRNRKPTKEEITKWYRHNQDGIGIAWYSGKKRLNYLKGKLQPDDVVKLVNELELPFVIHFRAATSGSRSAEMAHPFIIWSELNFPLKFTTQTESLLFHNGSISLKVEWIYRFVSYVSKNTEKLLKYESHLSDTAKLAFILSYINQDKRIKFLESLSHGDKFVVMTPTDIIRIGHFTEKDGILLSSECRYIYYYDYEIPIVRKECPFDGKLDETDCGFNSYSECPYILRDCPKRRVRF